MNPFESKTTPFSSSGLPSTSLLASFLEINKAVCSLGPLDQVLEDIAQAAAEVIRARASSIILIDEGSNQLVFAAVYGEKADELTNLTFPRDNHSVAGWVTTQARSMIINDVKQSPYFSGRVDEQMQFTTERMLCVPMIFKGRVIGCLEVLNKWLNEDFTEQDAEVLVAFGGQAAVAIDNVRKYEQLERQQKEMDETYQNTLLMIGDLIDLRDSNTAGHSRRVVAYTSSLAQYMGIRDREQLDKIAHGALLHDIGKLAIPDAILQKPGPLTKAEWVEMRRHPILGAQWIARIPMLLQAIPIVLNHHEWWNGAGYPDGLAGEDIPFEARIFAVCDAFDAITAERAYKPALSYDQAVQHLKTQSGRIYDPEVVETFLRLGEVHWRGVQRTAYSLDIRQATQSLILNHPPTTSKVLSSLHRLATCRAELDNALVVAI